jgi:hypothetical protein
MTYMLSFEASLLRSHGKRKFTALKTAAIDIPMVRVGRLEIIGPNGNYTREEVVKKCIKIVESHPETPSWRRNLAGSRRSRSRSNRGGLVKWNGRSG